jgi:hypothetical protein
MTKKSSHTIDSETLAKQMAEMICLLRKKAPFARYGAKAKTDLQSRFAQIIALAIDTGCAYGFYNGNKLIAFYLRYSDNEFVPGTQTVFVGHLPRHKPGIDVLTKMMRSDRRFFNEKTFLKLPPLSSDLVPFATKLGFSMSGIVLTGGRSAAAKGLAKIPAPRSLKSLGLSTRRISNSKEINQAISIQRREFTRNPQFGWIIGSRAFGQMSRNMMLQQISKQNKSMVSWVIVDNNDKVWGFYSMFIRINDPLWASTAVLGIILHQKIQGRGIVKNVYTHLLKEMKSRNIVHFMGSTAQPAVMGLAKVMRRHIFIREMKWGDSQFKPGHFS